MLEFTEQIISCRIEAISKPMTIYFWFDEMSGQFKFGLTSLTKNHLPFRCELEHVATLEEIVMLCLNSLNPSIIPNSELEEISINAAFQSTSEEQPCKLKVWSTVINE